jgi:hypothetical protein
MVVERARGATDDQVHAVLRAAAAGDPEALGQVGTTLGDRELLVPLRGADGGPAPPATLPVERPTSWPALVGTATQGAIPVYTDAASLARFRTRTRAIGCTLARVVELARACSVEAIALDPGTDRGLVLTAAEAVSAPPPSDQPTTAPSFWAPSHPVRALSGPLPAEDLRQLRDATAHLPDVRGVWAVELVDPAGVPHLVVALDVLDHREAEAIVTQVAANLDDRLLHPDQVGVDVLALTHPVLRDQVRALDVPIHPAPTWRAGRVAHDPAASRPTPRW